MAELVCTGVLSQALARFYGLLRRCHFVGLLLCGCAAVPPIGDHLRGVQGAASERRMAGDYTVTAVTRGEQIRRVYIEGDGRAYLDYGRPSGDPTPLKPVGLELALQESDFLYLGRPCQWGRGPECVDRTLWTRGRFTEQVAKGYADLIMRETEGRPVELVGFSGGAWVALQVAARLDNVTRVVTVAGNLMPNVVNARHKVKRMEVAAYPVGRLRTMPVVAYVGTRDKVVGPEVIKAYEAETGARVEVKTYDAGHTDGWEKLRID